MALCSSTSTMNNTCLYKIVEGYWISSWLAVWLLWVSSRLPRKHFKSSERLLWRKLLYPIVSSIHCYNSNKHKPLEMQVIYLQKTTGEALLSGRNTEKQLGNTHIVSILLTSAICETKRKRGWSSYTLTWLLDYVLYKTYQRQRSYKTQC